MAQVYHIGNALEQVEVIKAAPKFPRETGALFRLPLRKNGDRQPRRVALVQNVWQAVAVPNQHPHRARIITSLNLKGGVGKTHACWLIAGVCQERGHRCLVLDLDKQGNISTSLQVDGATAVGTDQFFNPGIDPEISALIQQTSLSHVDVIPGSFALERYNVTDPIEWEPTGLHRSLIDPLREVAPFYDYILLDCPADISLITFAALCAIRKAPD